MAPKTNEEWEAELTKRLETAKQELQNATDAQRAEAKVRYEKVLMQFCGLIVHGKIPEDSSQ